LNRNVIEVNVLNAGFSSGFAMFEHTVIGLLNHHESTNHFLGNEGAVIIVLSEGMVDQFWNAMGNFRMFTNQGLKQIVQSFPIHTQPLFFPFKDLQSWSGGISYFLAHICTASYFPKSLLPVTGQGTGRGSLDAVDGLV